jgi:hypothetical protein
VSALHQDEKKATELWTQAADHLMHSLTKIPAIKKCMLGKQKKCKM